MLFTTGENCIIDLVLIVDESGSIWKDTSTNPADRINNWALYMQPFIRNLITGLNVGQDQIRVGLVMFNNV